MNANVGSSKWTRSLRFAALAGLLFSLAAAALAADGTCACGAKSPKKEKAKVKAKAKEKQAAPSVVITGSNLRYRAKDGKPVDSSLNVTVLEKKWLDSQGRGSVIDTITLYPGATRGR